MRSSPLLAQLLGAIIGLGVALLRLLAKALTRSPTSATKSRISTSFSNSRHGALSVSVADGAAEAAWMENLPPFSPSLTTVAVSAHLPG